MTDRPDVNRREFLATGAAVCGAGPFFSTVHGMTKTRQAGGGEARGPMAMGSANGLRATERAVRGILNGEHPLDAVVSGINIIEDDPEDNSVGYGGLPNEEGVVELDASVMDGPTHAAGAVAGLRGIRYPSSVAAQVMRRTDHVLLVGEGALRFALRMGFKEENLLTDASREAWLKWRANLNPDDDWLDDRQREHPSARHPGGGGVPWTWGTVHCGAVTPEGHVVACTSTSGLSYKLPGRVGDSPIVGAGMYVDNEVGSAGATGRGEAVIQNCGAFLAVMEMARGVEPTQACLNVLKRIADRTRAARLLDARKRPNFNVTVYALRKDGAFGAASMWSGSQFAVTDDLGPRTLDAAYLYEREAHR